MLRGTDTLTDYLDFLAGREDVLFSSTALPGQNSGSQIGYMSASRTLQIC